MRRPKRNSSRPSTASDPVQTFLPYASFRRSARVLDSRRLGKQRVETLQVLRALEIEDYGWKSHPVVRMWRGYTEALVTYGKEMVVEWKMRGFGDSCFEQLMEFAPHARSQRALAQAGALLRGSAIAPSTARIGRCWCRRIRAITGRSFRASRRTCLTSGPRPSTRRRRSGPGRRGSSGPTTRRSRVSGRSSWSRSRRSRPGRA